MTLHSFGARRWQPATALTLGGHTPLLSWLQHPGSLTARLQAYSQGAFAVRVLSQYWGRAELSEARALGLDPRARVLVREVLLCGGGRPWVWARSILPHTSLRGRLRHLRQFDSRPLGAWLFRQPDLQRQPLEICRYRPEALPPGLERSSQPLWGRRSVFYVAGRPLLVGEVFLPEFVTTL